MAAQLKSYKHIYRLGPSVASLGLCLLVINTAWAAENRSQSNPRWPGASRLGLRLAPAAAAPSPAATPSSSGVHAVTVATSTSQRDTLPAVPTPTQPVVPPPLELNVVDPLAPSALSPSVLSDTGASAIRQVLDGRDIACRSAQNWTPAQVLRARARTVIQIYCEEDECTRKAAHALAAFLNMQANHQQDIGAASGLRAYYTRIALQEQLELSVESQQMVAEEQAKQVALRDSGLAAGTDISDFDRQLIRVEDQRLQLLSQDRQLRSLLAQLTKMDYAMSDVQQERLEVVASSLDCERLKQCALSLRQDLRGWSYLAGQINETSAPVFAKMLSTLIGGWALPLPAITGLKALLCPPDYSGLSQNMQHELNLTVQTHCQWISQAVDEKCAKLEVAYQRIELAKQTIASWESRIEQLDRLAEKGNTLPEDRAQARLGWLTARVEEVSRRLDARIAEIDLAEATGGLSTRCCQGLPWLLTGNE